MGASLGTDGVHVTLPPCAKNLIILMDAYVAKRSALNETHGPGWPLHMFYKNNSGAMFLSPV